MMRTLVAFTLLLTALVAHALVQAQPPAAVHPAAAVPAAQAPSTCDALINRAMDTAGTACGDLSRNQACYGNNLIHSELRPEATAQFATAGDIAAIDALQKIITTPLDEAAQTWGIAILKAQANIPGTLPGQNVTFILFGDTTVDNPTPDMRAVTISTGLGRLSCADAPPSAALVQSPGTTPVTMNINGADVTLGSTVLITATNNGVMTVSTIEGHAVVTAFGVSQTVLPGMQVTLPLGTDNELTVIQPPNPPEPFTNEDLSQIPLRILPQPVLLPPKSTAEATDETPEVTETLTAPTATLSAATIVACAPLRLDG